MQREIGAIVAIAVGLLFLEFLPRRISDLSHDTLRHIFRAVGLCFLLVASTTLAVAWKVMTPADAGMVTRLSIGWVGAVVIIFAGSDVWAWYASRRRYR